MKFSCIKYKNDNNSFKFFKRIGVEVYELDDPEQVDFKIRELAHNNCRTIIISNELAGFSEDIIKKYRRSDDVNIIIAASRRIGEN